MDDGGQVGEVFQLVPWRDGSGVGDGGVEFVEELLEVGVGGRGQEMVCRGCKCETCGFGTGG